MVAADLDDVESLKRAFAGAYGAFLLTNFWEHFSPEKELAQAKNMAQAAKQASLQHVIWSTLEDTRKWVPLSDNRMPTLKGKYKVEHFDAKGEADHLFTELGVPTTFLLTSFYWENFIYFGAGAQERSGRQARDHLSRWATRSCPASPSRISARCALAIFKKGKEFIGKTIGIAGEHLTGAQMAAALTKALGQEVRYNDVSPDVYRKFGFPGAEDLGNMFQFKRDFQEVFCGPRNPADCPWPQPFAAKL